MKDERKEKLLKFLFPTDEIRSFFCNDLFQEILNVIPKTRFINSNYTDDDNRKLVYKEVSKDIRKFLFANEVYSAELNKFYEGVKLESLTEMLIEGIIFFIINTDNRFTKIDIYNDKMSLCYSPISIADFL